MIEESSYLFMNNNSIYNNKTNNLESIIFYTENGIVHGGEQPSVQSVQTANGEQIYAKIVNRSNGTAKHMIRLDSNGKLFNPNSIYGLEKNKTFLDRICRSNEKFKEVNQKVFDLYIKFLNTKNIAWLNNAEREAE